MKCEWCDNQGYDKVETRPGSGMWIYYCGKHKEYAQAIYEHNKLRPLKRKMKK